MKLTNQIAKQLREVILDGEWVVCTNYKKQLIDLDWKIATSKIDNFNSIAELTFHIDYYIAGICNVFENGRLEISDKYSFDSTPVKSQDDWKELRNKLIRDTEKLVQYIEKMSDAKLMEVFVDEKYGNYYKNLNALIEHSYYHLGQIILIKKLLLQNKT